MSLLTTDKKEEKPIDIKNIRVYSYEDYCKLPDDGKRYEVIGGKVIEIPAPTTIHQTILLNMGYLIKSYLMLNPIGRVFFAPLDVELSAGYIVQPDVIFILKEKVHTILKTHIKGVPNILVEILSPSNKKYDLERKKMVYLKHKVDEYWILGYNIGETHFYILEEGKYIDISTEEGTFKSRVLDGLQFRVSDINSLMDIRELVDDPYYESSLGALKNEGIKIGKKEGLLEVAKKMLVNNIDIYKVSEYTGLSIDEINNLKNLYH